MSGNSLAEAVDDEMTRELNFLAEYCGGRLLLVDSSYRILFDTYSVTQNKYCISEQIIDTFGSRPYEHYSQKTEYLELAVPLRTRTMLTDGDDSITGVLLLSSSGAWIAKMINSMNRQVLLIEITGSMILFALSFIFAWTSSTPWKNLVTTLNQVFDGNLDVTFSTEGGYNETKEIINTFNQVLERLRSIDQSRQEFVSNVSHELRTPITSMRVLADSLILGDNVPVDIYREFMQDISDEIDRETKIINDLLTLVRMDKNATELNISQVNINNLVEQILKRVRPIAKTRSIEIVFESFRPVTADVDETKLSLAVTNLVENGVKYVVLGKYFAMLTVFAVPVAIACLCPLIIALNGTAFLLADYGAILAFFLLGAVEIAVGMLISSLTESQIIAAVGTFGLLLLLYLWDGLVGFLPSTAVGSLLGFFVVLILVCFLINALSNNWKVTAGVLVAGAAVLIAFYLRDSSVFANLLPDVLGKFSLLSAFDSFSTDHVFDVPGILLYLSISALLVFLTVQVIQKRRWN